MMRGKKISYKLFLWGLAAVLTIGAVLTAVLILLKPPSGQRKTTLETASSAIPEQFFYLKDNSVYHTYPDQPNPRVLIPDFAPGQGRLSPIFLSRDGKRLFYPLGAKDNADLYVCHFEGDLESHQKLASKVSLFSTNSDSGKMYYQSGNDLYAGNMDQFELIATKVAHYFASDEGDRIVYLTTDNSLYYKAWKQEAVTLAEQVALRYVSLDLNTIYYRKEGTLYLIKDCKDILEIYSGDSSRSIPILSCVFENGDCYFDYYTALYFYSHSEGVTRLINENIEWLSIAMDYSYSFLYPHLIPYAGKNPPVIFYRDKKGDNYIGKGAEILRKITGAIANSATIDPSGKGLYYVASSEPMNERGDLYYVALDGSSASESRLWDTNVSIFGHYYAGDTFVYFKNLDFNVADMYIDGKKVDSKVYPWTFSWYKQPLAPKTFLYLKNSRDYYNSKVDAYYTMDALMFYQDGTIEQISDNVIDFIIFEDSIVYLKVDDPDSDQGSLRLYRMDGEDLLIDEGVNALIRPCLNREYGGAIDPAFVESNVYSGDYE
jgi:hypothetical protein